ncbi:MAG: hypothetical protein QM820_25350 [Minicystis sp.]
MFGKSPPNTGTALICAWLSVMDLVGSTASLMVRVSLMVSVLAGTVNCAVYE